MAVTKKITAKKKSKKGKKNKVKLTPEQKAQKLHIKEIRSVFSQSGFSRVTGVDGKNINFMGVPCEMDDIFIYDNIILINEYTSITGNFSEHLKKKKVFFDAIENNPSDFILFLRSTFSNFKEQGSAYHKDQYKIKILYASKNKLDAKLKAQVPNVVYLDYPIVKYFLAVANAIKKSARNEILSYLGLNSKDLKGGGGCSGTVEYNGSILPEAHSNFKDGFKVLSFYVDPAALLNRSYVLRKDGWKDGSGLYQRMIMKSKVEAIRKHLRTKKRVFINNIIVTLPSSTKVYDADGDTVNFKTLTETAPVKFALPIDFNSIGIIDGQHRVYSYHEGGSHDDVIVDLRTRQNLLVTGIIYPKNLADAEKTKFEANLFLEINSNQSNAKSDLKQAIGVLLTPYSPASIGKQIVNHLNDSGPLFDQFERYFYDKDKIKTTSIISYGLTPIVKLQGNDSFFQAWNNSNKDKLLKESDSALLNEYIDFCVDEINNFFIAIKKSLPKERWTPDKKVKGRILTTTNINGFIICLRLLIENKSLLSLNSYEKKLKDLDKFQFDKYHSSQYGRLAQDIYKKFFS